MRAATGARPLTPPHVGTTRGHVRRARRTRRTRWRPAAGLLGLLAVAWVSTAIGLRIAYAGEVLPSTRVAGVELGGASPAEARDLLAAVSTAGRSVALEHRGQRFLVTARDIGFRLDAEATAAAAFKAGRDGPLAPLASPLFALGRTQSVTPVYGNGSGGSIPSSR